MHTMRDLLSKLDNLLTESNNLKINKKNQKITDSQIHQNDQNLKEALPIIPIIAGAKIAVPFLTKQGARILAGTGKGVAATPGAVAQVGKGVGAAGAGIGVGATGLAVNDIVQMAKHGVKSLGPLIESILGSAALQKIVAFSSKYGLPILAVVAILYGGKKVINFLRKKAKEQRQGEKQDEGFDESKSGRIATDREHKDSLNALEKMPEFTAMSKSLKRRDQDDSYNKKKEDEFKKSLSKKNESFLPQVGDEIGISFSEDFEIGSTITDTLSDGIVIDLDDVAVDHLLQNGITFLEGEIVEDKQHSNSKIYDKCWKGYKKVPGKNRGEKGSCVKEAEYQGRKVKLNKPMAGDVKKSKVYVRNPKGNVVKVNFGDKDMKIKKSNPARRKSFRARHNCDNPGPKHKARYWSCRSW